MLLGIGVLELPLAGLIVLVGPLFSGLATGWNPLGLFLGGFLHRETQFKFELKYYN